MRYVAAGALASLTLLAACGGGSSGPPGSIDTDCRGYAQDKTIHAALTDRYIDGIISVGLKPGHDAREANEFAATLETAYFVPLPYIDYALVCVKEGHEDEWIARIKALDWVEWSHREGIRPLLIEEDD